MPDTINETSKARDDIAKVPDKGKRRRIALEREEKETQEVLLAGQEDSQKAKPHVEAQIKETLEIHNKEADEIKNKLETHKRSMSGYLAELAQGLHDILLSLDWVRGWTADVVVTKKNGAIQIKGKPFATQEGILLVVTTPDGRVLHQGMNATREPTLDYAGIYTLALQVENTMDKERGLLLDGHESNGDGILDAHGRPITNGVQKRTG